MIAKIKTNGNKTYNSAVFAICYDGWKTRIVAFDEKTEKLQMIRMYNTLGSIKTLLFLIDVDKNGWVEVKKWKGFPWLIENKDILKAIEKGKPIPEEFMQKCREIQANIQVSEWTEITDIRSVENLMNASGWFHDGLISRVERKGKDAEIDIKVWGGVICFKLENAQWSENCEKGYGSYGEIFDSSIFFENGRIYWTNFMSCECFEEIQADDCWFSAEKMYWKLETACRGAS